MDFKYVRRLLKKTTSGTWEAFLGASGTVDVHLKESPNNTVIHWTGFDFSVDGGRQPAHDAEFIAWSRNNMEALLDNLEEQQKQNNILRSTNKLLDEMVSEKGVDKLRKALLEAANWIEGSHVWPEEHAFYVKKYRAMANEEL